MHRISLDDAPQVVLATEFVPAQPRDPFWPYPRFRFRFRTSYDSGVILDISNPRTLELLAAAARTLLRAHRTHLDATLPPAEAPKPKQRRPRPTPRTFPGL